jgi:hypothetical protein
MKNSIFYTFLILEYSNLETLIWTHNFLHANNLCVNFDLDDQITFPTISYTHNFDSNNKLCE